MRVKQKLDLLHRHSGNRRLRQLPEVQQRNDDPAGIMRHAGRYADGRALIVLGGDSGSRWDEIKNRVRPDVIMGGNGVNAVVHGLDYWMIAENMNYTSKRAEIGDARAIEFMKMFHREAGAKIKLVSHRSWNLLRDKTNCISIRRMGYEPGQIPPDFSLRVYGEGFMSGRVYREPEFLRLPQRVGNVGVHLLHMAGILGCAEIHTIGFDMLFTKNDHHHFYEYPIYQPDHFRSSKMFVKYREVNTQVIWIETARFLKSMESYFEQAGIEWTDHSAGLLKIEGLKCAK